jgi:hypothetical protein
MCISIGEINQWNEKLKKLSGIFLNFTIDHEDKHLECDYQSPMFIMPSPKLVYKLKVYVYDTIYELCDVSSYDIEKLYEYAATLSGIEVLKSKIDSLIRSKCEKDIMLIKHYNDSWNSTLMTAEARPNGIYTTRGEIIDAYDKFQSNYLHESFRRTLSKEDKGNIAKWNKELDDLKQQLDKLTYFVKVQNHTYLSREEPIMYNFSEK